MVIKLLMNAMYGKTVIKPFETYTIVKGNRDDFDKYDSYNYDYIDSVIEISGKFYIKKGYQSYLILIMSTAVLRF